ncbi:MAG: cupin domain-containing protein [Thiotrichales bacterium]|nr:cupin domain-containing protein [Thiotrichales bacterium]
MNQRETDFNPINMDFSQRVVVNTHLQDWVESPSKTVWRKPLEKEKPESGRTTSLVRFAENSQFASHTHPLGEEIWVLSGVFSDENGDYPAGSYLRNPPGSYHQPHSKSGCELFVKLDHFDQNDTETVRIQSKKCNFLPGQGRLEVLPLHSFKGEHTALVKWPAGEVFKLHRHIGGEEIFVIEGEFRDELGVYPAGTWLRNPHWSQHQPYVEKDTLILVKVGHL